VSLLKVGPKSPEVSGAKAFNDGVCTENPNQAIAVCLVLFPGSLFHFPRLDVWLLGIKEVVDHLLDRQGVNDARLYPLRLTASFQIVLLGKVKAQGGVGIAPRTKEMGHAANLLGPAAGLVSIEREVRVGLGQELVIGLSLARTAVTPDFPRWGLRPPSRSSFSAK
jgi:hypothetical protein